jgi:hypothetical protein
MFVSLGGLLELKCAWLMAGSAISPLKQRGFRIDIPIVLFVLPSYVDLFFLLLCGVGVGVGGLGDCGLWII